MVPRLWSASLVLLAIVCTTAHQDTLLHPKVAKSAPSCTSNAHRSTGSTQVHLLSCRLRASGPVQLIQGIRKSTYCDVTYRIHDSVAIPFRVEIMWRESVRLQTKERYR